MHIILKHKIIIHCKFQVEPSDKFEIVHEGCTHKLIIKDALRDEAGPVKAVSRNMETTANLIVTGRSTSRPFKCQVVDSRLQDLIYLAKLLVEARFHCVDIHHLLLR